MKQLKVYKVWQTVNNNGDTYDSAIVLAYAKKEAKKIHPNGNKVVAKKDFVNNNEDSSCAFLYMSWCFLEDVQVQEIGIATTGDAEQVICASFNAG